MELGKQRNKRIRFRIRLPVVRMKNKNGIIFARSEKSPEQARACFISCRKKDRHFFFMQCLGYRKTPHQMAGGDILISIRPD